MKSNNKIKNGFMPLKKNTVKKIKPQPKNYTTIQDIRQKEH